MQKLKELRLERGFTQSQIAQLLGVNQTAVGKYERGELEPNIETLKKLADFFECSIDYLTGRADDLGVISINSTPSLNPSPSARELLTLFEGLPQEYKAQVLEYVRYFAERTSNQGRNRRA